VSTPQIVRRTELADAGQTPGMVRRVAFESEGLWIGLAETDAGAVSGWHHHGDNTTYVYCAKGAIRLESGPKGGDALEAGPGEFLLIPANTVHRESNPSVGASSVVVIRIGSGPVLANVDGPDPA
jgi:uncharacterized RmlC-like cupin family protein